jgi:hypothetical protein
MVEWWKVELFYHGGTEDTKNGTTKAIEGNVEALAEIPLRREKNGMVEWWNCFTTEARRTQRMEPRKLSRGMLRR